jgi:MFS family permease
LKKITGPVVHTVQTAATAVAHFSSSHLHAPHLHLRPAARLSVSRRSRAGLYIANFLLAELVGVLIPVLNDYLLDNGWDYESIGVATAMAGLGLLAMQFPAGIYLDRITSHRKTLMVASVVVGCCFGAMPLMVHHKVGMYTLLLLSGAGQAFMMPLLGTLALLLAGHAGVNKLMGESQSYNHAGNIAASYLVMVLVVRFGTQSAFFAITGVSLFAAASCLIIAQKELHPESVQVRKMPWLPLLQEPRVQRLVLCSLFFHLANAAVTPIVALYSLKLGAAHGFVTFLIFVAQAAMVLAAFLAGRFGDQIGRKPVMAAAFLILPLRIVLYAWLCDPNWFLAVAVLDGLGVGTYQVIIASMCADIDADRGRFNTLISLMFATLALGGVISPLLGGVVVQRFGFQAAFYMFAAIAAVGAALFALTMPETQAAEEPGLPIAPPGKPL